MTFETLAAFEHIHNAFIKGDEFHDKSYVDTVKEYIRFWKRELETIEANNYYQD